ncbi:MFS transporter [Leucobacter sp. OLJS4]|uniref:MFS transporter n=1 Tax=unclassified Leucobacter TaxID=2621730 RepID=UPI000C187A7D|nr:MULTISPECIES: MFS transporter [unclassified Leucobacter]PII83764.1 MFS transporter [Leucobacter sp. OLCALW19]PII89297.1 MFS transporter [Leucobacter sp. OLTLW20]PII90706.1 MFS transporter [Leucobacter sp. OLAS13]PII99579.1 MFS transporter [Leucobacter sp. OLDS2]PIJ01764.1 MFS transporter [Leucobacter sp. OLCS4]
MTADTASATGSVPAVAARDVDSAIRGERAARALSVVSLIAMMAGASAPSPFYPGLAESIGFGPSTISAVFAVYALALLLTLLTAGSISDHIGRRPVAIVGLLVLAGGLVVFWHADSVALLVIARVIQGVASGLLLSSLSASITDLEPASRPGSAAIWNALGPGVGLALGALVSGIALDLTRDAMADVFGPLAALYVLLALLFVFAPETAPRRPGALASLAFRLSLPLGIRADFWRSAPAIVAGWATGGLFLSFGASIVRAQLGGTAHLAQGLSVALLAGTGAVAALAIRRRSPRTVTVFGTAALALGTALSLVALGLGSLPGYLAAAAVTGAGFGTAFFGVVSALAPNIPATQRADVFSVIFLFSYLAFGIPTVVAGLLAPMIGLGPVVAGYGAFVIVLAVIACILRIRRS